ncbi:hypothetical protein TrRE_jg3838 [Triparma retinervis]|uniref:Uncharacterized protein n=1 Tax=Triparma retinervis TaxID=2557542 RepID=A0A9W7EEE1_9STRA|nr:hypothetical protein TrRE_jg3838 [Triparma retinervis]
MDIAKQFMGEIDHEMPGDASDPDEETVMVDSTSAPTSTPPLSEVLLDRHWVFEEVLWIKGSSTNMSRSELQETVADAKGVDLSRVMVCFFDEDELSHPVVTEKLGAAGPPAGDVVTVWCTKYKPAAFRRYSRKWVKIKKRMDGLPKRWYLVTAIRKDALLDDERDQHLSAEEVVEKVPEKSAAELLEESRKRSFSTRRTVSTNSSFS